MKNKVKNTLLGLLALTGTSDLIGEELNINNNYPNNSIMTSNKEIKLPFKEINPNYNLTILKEEEYLQLNNDNTNNNDSNNNYSSNYNNYNQRISPENQKTKMFKLISFDN